MMDFSEQSGTRIGLLRSNYFGFSLPVIIPALLHRFVRYPGQGGGEFIGPIAGTLNKDSLLPHPKDLRFSWRKI
jgi:hypothetical protein